MGFSTFQSCIPSWTGFDIVVNANFVVLKSSIRYLDCIDNPATDISTIYQVMNKALGIIESLKLESIVCVFDQAIYSKAAEIKWREPEKFANCVLMMGIFHLLMTYMSILSKRFSDAGLCDTLLQSSVVAEGSIHRALSGKHYNRGIRLYKLFYEALVRLILIDIEQTVDKQTAAAVTEQTSSAENLNSHFLFSLEKNIRIFKFTGIALLI